MNGGWLKGLSITVGVAALVACGSGDQTAGIDRGGSTRVVSVVGPITGFGSIVVNGVHYAVDHAQIEVDGDAGTVADLELGQVVSIVGEQDASGTTGTADTVHFLTNVRGPITAVDVSASAITVLGQTIVVGQSTVLDLGARPAAFSSLMVGDLVAVSGFVSAHGAIEATRIESATAGAGLLASGTVSALDAGALHFNLGALVVDYSQAALIEGFASGGPSNGDRVIVKGTSVAPSGALVAREVRHVVDDDTQPGREAEIEGLITRFVSALDFDVAGKRVTTTAATTYEGGGAAALALNARVEVQGTTDASGTIVARTIEFDD
ncbi:MAG TPA: DUF5666 domain-containing protein [Gammaproteobacteria bacterium]|nr:DUF5666 domain-containing protein [Gammaproteobacteria bacterium]